MIKCDLKLNLLFNRLVIFHKSLMMLEFFKLECDRALENIQGEYKKMTEELVSDLARIKNPPAQLQEVCSKFVLMVRG